MNKSFVICQVSWLTQTPGMEGERDSIVRDFYFLTKFLQDNGLVRRPLMHTINDITDEFAISSGDLTDDGLAVMKAAYEKWVEKIDNGMPPEDVTLLEKALKKVRAAEP
jgi:hypothetical protein